MYVAPGYRMDYYKKVMLLQRHVFSGGRFYFGSNDTSAESQAPGEDPSIVTSLRNNIYVLFFYQSPTLYGPNIGGSPDFTISV